MQLLVVEDDPVIGQSLRQGFLETGDGCLWATDGERGLELARGQTFDAVVLDILLPARDGLAVLRTLRHEGNQTPVVLLTALGSEEERVAGLRAGADDYLVKPFAFAELRARLEAVNRRATAHPTAVLAAGDLQMDLSARRVTRGGHEIELTPTEFSLLELLMRHAGQVVTRKMLCEHLWETDWEGSTNVIEVHITRVRGKLNRGLERPVIHTVRGRGYVVREA
ncbi:response regulator transcription factor [Frigoriglobus tundricola]|uniref:Response regulator in two-component regulatory system with PhoQ n=1 Tax=Frigoriglobus tundricola TaxID=2774151 RepID=A0A6M5Z598_9BACT|nr:response regulator transcription factor [Frigoriglobus tundricola]QJX00987.1 response regulator in two-component regulatory system with PhoQ [Frigoriglobus tundricola]